jgi:hypothetical protein
MAYNQIKSNHLTHWLFEHSDFIEGPLESQVLPRSIENTNTLVHSI